MVFGKFSSFRNFLRVYGMLCSGGRVLGGFCIMCVFVVFVLVWVVVKCSMIIVLS